jgi:hypothetical protein
MEAMIKMFAVRGYRLEFVDGDEANFTLMVAMGKIRNQRSSKVAKKELRLPKTCVNNINININITIRIQFIISQTGTDNLPSTMSL